jgi:hypothetical protein
MAAFGAAERANQELPVTKRLVVVLLTPVRWAPPGVAPGAFRSALAEDLVDLLAALAQADGAIAATAADRPLAEAVGWPGMRLYELAAATPLAALHAAAVDGYDQAAVLAADVPDLPGMVLGKLLQPLDVRPVAVAPALGGAGLFGVAARLPVPEWLPDLDLDTTEPLAVRAAAPRPGAVGVTPGWHRLRGPADLARLDPALEGWDATRALLGG